MAPSGDSCFDSKRIHLLLAVHLILQSTHVFRGVGSEDLTQGYFKMYKDVSKRSIGQCWTETSVYKMGCLVSCARKSLCAGVFLEMAQDGRTWQCTLCDHPWPSDQLTSGNGHYGLPKFGDRGSKPVAIFATQVPIVVVINGRNTASYHCNSGIKFKLFYDLTNYKWPNPNQACQLSMCLQKSLDGSILDMAEDSSGVLTLIPTCPSTDKASGRVTCTHGAWNIESSDTLLLCVPSTCWRLNSQGRAIYSGTQNHTDHGLVCQYWTQQYPHGHSYVQPSMYPADHWSFGHNYCRDPKPDGSPWCYTLDPGIRWQWCSSIVPQC